MKKGKQQIDFMGLGVAKSGTSKLSELLIDHPDICLSEPRDIQYYNSIGSYLNKGNNPNFTKDIQWYENHYNHCSDKKQIGEFSTVYFYCPTAIAKIKKQHPQIKLIIIVRQPAERAFSHYQMLRFFQKKEARAFSKLIREVPEFIERGRFGKQLKQLLTHFNRDRILIIENEQLKNNPKEICQSLYQFLSVDASYLPKNLETTKNTAKGIRFVGLSKIYGTAMELMIDFGFSPIINLLRKTGIKKLYDRLNYKQVVHDTMQAEDRKYIMDELQEDIVLFEELSGLDLTHWRS